MNLKTMVTFDLFARNVDYHKRYNVCNIDDIRNFIQQHINLFDTPSYMEVSRLIHIVDLDEPENGIGFKKFDKTYFNGFQQITSFYHSDSFKFVFPVMYPNDIRKYVSKHPWHKTLVGPDLGLDKRPDDIPVVIRDFTEKTPQSIHMGTRWESLNKETYVGVDQNMNQVWPAPATNGTPPISLMEFFKKTTEIIR